MPKNVIYKSFQRCFLFFFLVLEAKFFHKKNNNKNYNVFFNTMNKEIDNKYLKLSTTNRDRI